MRALRFSRLCCLTAAFLISSCTMLPVVTTDVPESELPAVMSENGLPAATDPVLVAKFQETLSRTEKDEDPSDWLALGEMYAGGLGTKRDVGKAIDWYRKASDAGSALASWRISGLFENAPELNTQRLHGIRSIRWAQKAAEQGNADAQYKVGIRYTEGAMIEEAPKWLEAAARQGHVQAMMALADLYESGKHNVTRVSGGKKIVHPDTWQAAYWLEAAAKAGSMDAQYRFGMIMAKGGYRKPDYKEALGWFLKAAEQGHAAASMNVAQAYAEGDIFEENHEKALKWFRAACEKNYSAGCFRASAMEKQIAEEKAASEKVTKKAVQSQKKKARKTSLKKTGK